MFGSLGGWILSRAIWPFRLVTPTGLQYFLQQFVVAIDLLHSGLALLRSIVPIWVMHKTELSILLFDFLPGSFLRILSPKKTKSGFEIVGIPSSGLAIAGIGGLFVGTTGRHVGCRRLLWYEEVSSVLLEVTKCFVNDA